MFTLDLTLNTQWERWRKLQVVSTLTQWSSISYKRQYTYRGKTVWNLYEINRQIIWISGILIGQKTRLNTNENYCFMKN